ncbi:MAG: hypothetical protein ACREPX_01790 [Rhodanobacteraceae bacterium]
MSPQNNPLFDLAVLVRDLCQLRRGPQDAPYSPRLLGALLAASVFLDTLIGTVLDRSPHALARSLVSTGLVLALCAIALSIRQLMSRYVQTATALVACSIALTLLALPILALIGPVPTPPATMAPLQVLMSWALLAMLIWNLAVNAHIVRHAMDAPFAFGLALVVAWTVADWALAHALFDARN